MFFEKNFFILKLKNIKILYDFSKKIFLILKFKNVKILDDF